MVRITNGKEVLTVTHNAYKEVFSRSGYRLYDEPHPVHEKPEPEKPKVKQYIKPISQWTRKELVDYITEHGYRAEGKTDELRMFVKKHMEEAE